MNAAASASPSWPAWPTPRRSAAASTQALSLRPSAFATAPTPFFSWSPLILAACFGTLLAPRRFDACSSAPTSAAPLPPCGCKPCCCDGRPCTTTGTELASCTQSAIRSARLASTSWLDKASRISFPMALRASRSSMPFSDSATPAMIAERCAIGAYGGPWSTTDKTFLGLLPCVLI